MLGTKYELQEQLQYRSFIEMFFKMSNLMPVYESTAILIVSQQ